ncbi:MFS transporter [Novosphingobium lindaniclasticum]|jgi:MFS family permease|uniref:MFS transporter n=1 Tax=Novosphingobium lindaniclasticum TaxID=1329895 RepID=UPI0024093B6B|nr:MFS transporter [Novosphingobium lindaniclasticum]
MSGWQWFAILLTACLNGLDGIDVLSISYVAPVISSDWSIQPSALGWVLSMELIGMAAGSVLLGGTADRYGRRPTIIACLGCMSAGMLAASRTHSILALLFVRLFTGLGIGGMLAAINAAAAEYSNGRRRNIAMALMVIGYPLGGAVGGLLIRGMLTLGASWRDVFAACGLITAIFIPVCAAFLPETPAFLDASRNLNGLARANRSLRRLGHLPASELSDRPKAESAPVAMLFSPALRRATFSVTVAYFAHISSFYFLVKWTPKAIVNLGFAPTVAAGVLALANVGGAIGGATFGILASRWPIRIVCAGMLVATSTAIGTFGWSTDTLQGLQWQVFFAGLFANSAIAGLYLFVAQCFPTDLRATGTGFVIGIGRGGAALGPVIAGYLFAGGLPLHSVAALMGCGSALAALAIWHAGKAENPILANH